jgi:HAD superfamily hydrolase (TIGR01459 family)
MSIRLLNGLSEIASDYDALLCDLWGVVHDGHHVHDPAADALRRFRASHGAVILLTNAPRLPETVVKQLTGFGVSPDCYDAIVSSGSACRAELAVRAARGKILLYYIGTENEHSIFEGLDVALTPLEEADVVLCAGLRADLTETPADYADELASIAARSLTMLCANPDIVVHRGQRLCWCAGALAREYEALGGQVTYYGKPHAPVYDLARSVAKQAKRLLAIGDGTATDIKGANSQGLDALFIAEGVHGKDIEPYTAAHLTEFLSTQGVYAQTALRSLKW